MSYYFKRHLPIIRNLIEVVPKLGDEYKNVFLWKKRMEFLFSEFQIVLEKDRLRLVKLATCGDAHDYILILIRKCGIDLLSWDLCIKIFEKLYDGYSSITDIEKYNTAYLHKICSNFPLVEHYFESNILYWSLLFLKLTDYFNIDDSKSVCFLVKQCLPYYLKKIVMDKKIEKEKDKNKIIVEVQRRIENYLQSSYKYDNVEIKLELEKDELKYKIHETKLNHYGNRNSSRKKILKNDKSLNNDKDRNNEIGNQKNKIENKKDITSIEEKTSSENKKEDKNSNKDKDKGNEMENQKNTVENKKSTSQIGKTTRKNEKEVKNTKINNKENKIKQLYCTIEEGKQYARKIEDTAKKKIRINKKIKKENFKNKEIFLKCYRKNIRIINYKKAKSIIRKSRNRINKENLFLMKNSIKFK